MKTNISIDLGPPTIDKFQYGTLVFLVLQQHIIVNNDNNQRLFRENVSLGGPLGRRRNFSLGETFSLKSLRSSSFFIKPIRADQRVHNGTTSAGKLHVLRTGTQMIVSQLVSVRVVSEVCMYQVLVGMLRSVFNVQYIP